MRLPSLVVPGQPVGAREGDRHQTWFSACGHPLEGGRVHVGTSVLPPGLGAREPVPPQRGRRL